MNKRILILFASIASIVLFFSWISSRDRIAPASLDRADAPAGPSSPTEKLPSIPEVIDAPAAVARETVIEPAPAVAVEPKNAGCIVVGRAADENDVALAGVAVRIAAYKVWTEGVDVPRLPGKYDMRGYEMTTGADGKFRFEMPVPTAPTPWLTLEPDPFHDSARLILGGTRPESKPPLHHGENDFGTIRLTTTGAIRGSVRDEAGVPIAEAKLMLGPGRSQTLQRDAFSDAAGNYVVGHSPAGPMGINASAEGFLSEFRKPIDVELGRFTERVDFVLRKAPTLSGLVVDDTGRPIEGVKLWGWPQSSGSGAGGKSIADGTFTISLPQDEPFTLEATREGFEPFAVDDRSTYYAPGSRDLRIVMKRIEAWSLLVVDGATNQPITKFGHEMLPNMSDHAPHSSFTDVRASPGVDHPDGRVSVSFRPGIDVVDVAARGYEPQRFDPKAGKPPDGQFVVKLVPTASVYGRVRIAGMPSGGVTLRLEAGRMVSGSSRGANWAGDHFEVERDGTSLTTSAPDGTFRFVNAQKGTFRLVARAPSGEAASVEQFTVKASASVDLGTIDLVPGAVVQGVVLVPAGRRAAGLTLRLDDRNFGESQVTDADGRFRFAALIPGAHQVLLREVPGSIGIVPPLEVRLEAGEVREVELDARECGTCRVDFTILIGERPAANAQVRLVNAEGRKSIELGITDREGRLACSAPLAKAVGISIWTAERIQMNHPTAKFDLTLDAQIVETVRFDTASVVVVLPPSLILPAKCNVRFELQPPAGSTVGPLARYFDVAEGATKEARVTVIENGRRLRFDDVPAGDWELVFDISDATDPTETVQLGANRRETHRKAMYAATSNLKLASGETETVELR
ncbi:MAG TPA: carboxypeptidase-like regulatory domain-containing protein [Planctomycetota bacterium]|nr:carboxypeptidase-like regulatory domain-containing protein [Planctomycetota bacterium]